jgi:hypothetical protein
MKGTSSTVVWIENEQGDRLPVKLEDEGGQLLGTLFIEAIPYHVFFADKHEIVGEGIYRLDADPDYQPALSKSGRYALISPYST